MERTIVLHPDMQARLYSLGGLDDNIEGVLVGQRAGEGEIRVDQFYLIGIGRAESAARDPREAREVAIFLERHPDYIAIPFHTHGKKIVRETGAYLETHLSVPDEEHFGRKLAEDPSYVAVVATASSLMAWPGEVEIEVRREEDQWERKSLADSLFFGAMDLADSEARAGAWKRPEKDEIRFRYAI